MQDALANRWVERLTLTNFRNYQSAILELSPQSVILIGMNGSGKTNLLEATSLLAPGQGLRRAPYNEISRASGEGGWSVAALIQGESGCDEIGTGLLPSGETNSNISSGRIVRINGVTKQGSGALAGYVDISWVTPSMDSLFTGPSSERRRFLDRIVLSFVPEHARRFSAFERAMQQRNRLLIDNVTDKALFLGLEGVMAQMAVAIAAARTHVVSDLVKLNESRRSLSKNSPFPWAKIALEGTLETNLENTPALDVEDYYMSLLHNGRERDRAAGRTLEGPHRTDFIVFHGPKSIPARLCSTGEQKALLLGLVLSHAELASLNQGGRVPILLLDEVTAHLDADRREGLCREILRLGSQAWMTGTDFKAFEAFGGEAQALLVHEGDLSPL
ncbi:MAG: DNA replication/repair protein RecF [Hyphomicrobium sp.]